jgi:hypothetical protein
LKKICKSRERKVNESLRDHFFSTATSLGTFSVIYDPNDASHYFAGLGSHSWTTAIERTSEESEGGAGVEAAAGAEDGAEMERRNEAIE